MKFKLPISLSVHYKTVNHPSLFKNHVVIPKYKKHKCRKQFLYQSTKLWNKYICRIFELPNINEKLNILIPGSCKNSDFATPVSIVKQKFKNILLDLQSSGDCKYWEPLNTHLKK